MSYGQKHWAESLEPGDICRATIRIPVVPKNLIDVEVTVLYNLRYSNSILAHYDKTQCLIEYNDLKQTKQEEKK